MSRWHTTEWDLLPERAFDGRGAGKWHRMTLEGGKGGDTPPPDPRLIAAQIRSLDKQGMALDQIMANSNAMLPLQKEQMQFGLDSARTAYDQSQADRGWMLDRRGMLSGLQDQLVGDARDFNSDVRRNEMVGQAQADVNAGFSNARGQGLRTLSRMGVNPNSGRAMAMNNTASLAQAAALADASNKTRQAARMEGFALTDRASNALAGYPAMGMQATGAGAGYGTAGLGLTNQGLAGMNSGYGAAGALGGQMGNNATNMWNAQSQASQKANDSDSQMFGSLVGTAATVGVAI